MNINESIKKLVSYALEKNLIDESEVIYSTNFLLDVLNLDEYVEPDETYNDVKLEPVLKELVDYAVSKGLVKEDSPVFRDLFDTKIMNCFTMRPKQVIDKFFFLYKESPKEATDWYYSFSEATDYIRTYRVKKDIKYKTIEEIEKIEKYCHDDSLIKEKERLSKYGDIDITINLSKPEKDPHDIALAKSSAKSEYPKCQLCKENEGYRGRVDHSARNTMRLIPLVLDGDDYFLQYSPFSYYNEHCIVLNSDHVPMVIDEKTFKHLFSFVDMFPHYFLGSNADLPIVGGSILSHDHYQGGRYHFSMFDASDRLLLSFSGYEDIKASYLCWSVSVIRLKSQDEKRLISLASKILTCWRDYTDKEAFIFAYTDGVNHNTITPILHKDGDVFILDLALRNNITTEDYPLGVYHPHPEYFNIKKENIGLIEVMGLAVLPARLKKELATVKDHILTDRPLDDELTSKHSSWVKGFIDSFTYNEDNIDDILKAEVGLTFMKVLECSGVYKQDEEGDRGLLRFVDEVNKR